MRVCLDAGHGGPDPGAIGAGGLQEKDVTLSLVRIIQHLINTDAASEIECLLTRNTDDFKGLRARSTFANQQEADLFVSVHCNAHTGPIAGGIETYYFPDSERGRAVAAVIQKRLVAVTGLRNRGVKTARFSVLRHTIAPAILVEVGFLSNPEEEDLLRNWSFLITCAKAIKGGIEDACKGWKGA